MTRVAVADDGQQFAFLTSRNSYLTAFFANTV
jgi:hypothetical protein